ncbi:peroxiredoxin [Xanthomonadaceae bacterium XH05]|nr:peroxiredoxin [Xanthomonadaceae bacterium XH05]
MIETGDTLPDLSFTLSDGGTARFSDYAGRWLVLYFYPKDSTPGCTIEAGDFRDLADAFADAGTTILGVSRDSVKSHQNFIAKQSLPFALISDTDEAVCQAFGVIQEKNMYGRKVMGIVRSTFLIDPNGRIAHAWRGVKVPGHALAVLDQIKALA